MNHTDIVVILIIAGIVGLAVWYVCKSRKKGRKCIGCPDGGSCGSCNGTCGSGQK